MNESLTILTRLMRTIQQRAQDRPEGSYTTKLVEGGVEKIGKKIIEEAGEVVEAAGEPDAKGKDHFVYECGVCFTTCLS
ncbi:MAG: phosphoribosyl-ATP diphosphatase [Pirellulaceae bacterium]